MPLEFYSPNAKKTGAALFVSFNSKEGSAYLKLLQQTSWDFKTKKGGFKGGQTVNIKMSADEVGAFIETVRNKGKTSFFHVFGEERCSGKLNYYSIDGTDKEGRPTVKEGFGLTIKKNNLEFKVGFTLGSAERLMEYLRFAFDHMFSAIYSADKKEAEERFKKKAAESQKPTEDETNELEDDSSFDEEGGELEDNSDF